MGQTWRDSLVIFLTPSPCPRHNPPLPFPLSLRPILHIVPLGLTGVKRRKRCGFDWPVRAEQSAVVRWSPWGLCMICQTKAGWTKEIPLVIVSGSAQGKVSGKCIWDYYAMLDKEEGLDEKMAVSIGWMTGFVMKRCGHVQTVQQLWSWKARWADPRPVLRNGGSALYKFLNWVIYACWFWSPVCSLAELANRSFSEEKAREWRAVLNFLYRSHCWNLFTTQRGFCLYWPFAEFTTEDWFFFLLWMAGNNPLVWMQEIQIRVCLWRGKSVPSLLHLSLCPCLPPSKGGLLFKSERLHGAL